MRYLEIMPQIIIKRDIYPRVSGKVRAMPQMYQQSEFMPLRIYDARGTLYRTCWRSSYHFDTLYSYFVSSMYVLSHGMLSCLLTNCIRMCQSWTMKGSISLSALLVVTKPILYE